MLLEFCTCARLQITFVHNLQLPTCFENTSGFSPKVFSHPCRYHIERFFQWTRSFDNIITSHSKLYLTESCMIEKISSWNKKVSVVQFHDHSFIKQCKYCQMFLSSFASQEGNQVKHGQQSKSKKRDSTALGRLQQYRWVYSPPSCCSSRKDVRKRCHCTVCTWKRSLLMCAISIIPYFDEYDGETIELVTSFPS